MVTIKMRKLDIKILKTKIEDHQIAEEVFYSWK